MQADDCSADTVLTQWIELEDGAENVYQTLDSPTQLAFDQLVRAPIRLQTNLHRIYISCEWLNSRNWRREAEGETQLPSLSCTRLKAGQPPTSLPKTPWTDSKETTRLLRSSINSMAASGISEQPRTAQGLALISHAVHSVNPTSGTSTGNPRPATLSLRYLSSTPLRPTSMSLDQSIPASQLKTRSAPGPATTNITVP